MWGGGGGGGGRGAGGFVFTLYSGSESAVAYIQYNIVLGEIVATSVGTLTVNLR